MEHGYKGASDLANRMAISFQWDATSDVIDDWMYDQYAEKYALDPEMEKMDGKGEPLGTEKYSRNTSGGGKTQDVECQG